MRTFNFPESMLELMFNLPDEQLAEIVMERPEVMKSICMGLTLELSQIESLSRKSKPNKKSLN